MGHPESEHWGDKRAPGAPMHTHPAPGGCGAGQASQRQAQRDLAKPNFPPGSPGPPDTSTESIFRRAWKAPVFWAEAEPQSQRQPRAVPGHGVHRAPPSVSCASDGGGQKPTSGPPPRWPAPPPWPRWQVCGTGSGSGAQIHRTGSGLRQRPRLHPARSFPLARASGCCPAPASRPLPGRGAPPGAPSPARPQRPKAGRHWEGEGGGTPARMGAPRPLPRYCSRRLQEAAGWSRVRELSGLASPPAS